MPMKLSPAVLEAYAAAHQAADILTVIVTAEKVTNVQARQLDACARQLQCATLEIKARLDGVEEAKIG